MKQIVKSVFAIIIGCVGSNFVMLGTAQALEEGLYWSGGSRYIRITN